jgi:hypothetical protein
MSRLAVLVMCSAALTACGGATPRAQDPVKVRRGNLVIVETHVPRQITFTQFARNEPKMLRRAAHARSIRVRETTYRGQRALRVGYRLGPTRVVQYFVRRGELMYVSTYTYR